MNARQRTPRRVSRAIVVFGAIAVVTPAASLTAQADPTSLVPGQTFRDCPSCPEMVVVPAGTFIMGSPESEAGRLRVVYDQEGEAIEWTTQDTVRLEVGAGQRLVIVEGPQRYVTIAAPFAVGIYEVTFEEWDACARGGGCGGLIPDHEGWGRGRRPVIDVSWTEARSYAEWLSGETGEAYRLPSEAEWEYVARAETETARYWGETDAGQCRHANGVDAAALQEYPDWITAPCSDGIWGRRQWDRSRPTRSGCTTRWATCGSGRWTAGTSATRVRQPTAAPGSRATARIACHVVAVG